MRKSLHVFTTVLAAGVSLTALTGVLSAPAIADTPDIDQQQARVDQLQSKAESLRQEAQELGGSRRVRESIDTVKGRMIGLDQDITRTEERVEQMSKNKAELDRVRKEVGEESLFGVGDAAEAGVKHKVMEAVEHRLLHGSPNAGMLVGGLGWAMIPVKIGIRQYYVMVRRSELHNQRMKESNLIIDKLRFVRVAQEEKNTQAQNLERLEQIQREENANNAALAEERTKLQRMTGPGFEGSKEAKLGRDQDLPGDKREESKSKTWRGITKSNQISFGGGYFESNAPQQFIGRVVVGGDDTAMIYTSPTLAGFYAEAEADFWDTGLRYAGEFGGIRLAAGYSDGEGDEYRRVEADPAITTGFVWIDPLDSGTPFAVGLGGTNLAWDARTSTQQIDAAATALYMQYRSFSSDLVGGVGVGVMANYRNTEHRTRIENLDFAGFAIDEHYNLDTFAFGPRAEASLEWDCDPEGDGPYPRLSARLRAMIGLTHDWRSSEVSQRAIGPFFGGFDYAQRVKLDDDGFNVRYGVDATFDLKFDARNTAFLKVGWQGQSDAPTIVPADGSFAPGAPIRADTESADEWYAGIGLRTKFDF